MILLVHYLFISSQGIMSTVSASDLLNDMIVEIDNDEFESFAFLSSTEERAVDYDENVSSMDNTEETYKIKGLLILLQFWQNYHNFNLPHFVCSENLANNDAIKNWWEPEFQNLQSDFNINLNYLTVS